MRIADVDFDIANAARRVIEGSLCVVAGERVVVIVDTPREQLGKTLADVARSIGAEAELVPMDTLGPRPIRSVPPPLRATLARAQASIMLIGFEEGEWPMRSELLALTKELNLRHAHMVGVSRRAMLAGFSVDPQRILDATRAVRVRLRPDSVLRLRSATGSDLEVKADPACRWGERVGILRPGRWENLPSGELFTCPREVNGIFVCDGSMGGHFGAAAGALARTPVRIEIKTSVFRSLHCIDRGLGREVERFLHSEPNCDRVGMTIVGTNVGMREASGEIICDQNLPGVHIGFGATYPELTGAKWNAPAQLTMTSQAGDVDLDGTPLLRSGRYLVL